MLTEAEESERRSVEALKSARPRPFLAGVIVDAGRNLVAQIVRASPYAPGPEEFSFNVLKNGAKVYAFKADVRQWKIVQPNLAGSEPTMTAFVNRVNEWLDRNDANWDFYLGEALLPSSFSIVRERGIQLELEGADSRAPRIVFR